MKIKIKTLKIIIPIINTCKPDTMTQVHKLRIQDAQTAAWDM